MSLTTERAGTMPSLELLSQLTDSHVLDQLLSTDSLTRAEISSRTGISKPTISESVRRLLAAGLLVESGRQVGGRGRSGTYYRLQEQVGLALALSAGPDGVIVETADLKGTVLYRSEHDVAVPVTSADLEPIMVAAVTEAVRTAPGPFVAGCVSVAGPVDQHSGQLVRMPNSPFLLDELNPRDALSDLVGVPVSVDNDVNWAALAEHVGGSAGDLDDFFYCYLGPGLGGAVVRQGGVVHGHRGFAGEIAHVLTVGPSGRAMRLVECFAAWDLLQPGSAAIDVLRLTEVLAGRTVAHRRVRDAVAAAVAGAIGSVTALVNPAGVVLGGPWSTVHGFDDRLAERVHAVSVVEVDVRTGTVGAGAPLVGARSQAVRDAQRTLTARA